MHHGRGADKGHEPRRVIGLAPGHLVAFRVPGLHQIRVGRFQYPVAGRRHRVGHDLVDQAGGLGFHRIGKLALKQEGCGGQRAHLAGQAGGAARARKDADHDFRQADLGLGVIGGKDAMRGQRQFQPDPQRGAGQGGGDGLAAFQGLGVHARALDLAQKLVQAHHAVEHALRAARPHAGDDVQIHPAGEILLARGDDDALHGVIGQRVVNQAAQGRRAVHRQHVHRLSGHVPGDDGDALGVLFHGEIGHFVSPFGARSRGAVHSLPS